MIRVLILIFLFISSNLSAEENTMILKLKDGEVKIELFPDVAPRHVAVSYTHLTLPTTEYV